MLAVYVALIRKGMITIDAVPASSRTRIAEALETAEIKRNIV